MSVSHLMLVWLMMLPITQLASKKFQVDVRGKESNYLLFSHDSLVDSDFGGSRWFNPGVVYCVYVLCTEILLDAIGTPTAGHIPLSSTSPWNQR